MSIQISKKYNMFKLDTRQSSYLIQVTARGCVGHLYYGDKIELSNDRMTDSDAADLEALLGAAQRNCIPSGEDREKVNFEDTFSWEYGMPGYGDFREPCVEVNAGSGSEALEFVYTGYEVLAGKPQLEGLPSTFSDDCETLVIHMSEPDIKLDLSLYYSVFEEEDAITRWATVTNRSDEKRYLERALSLCLDVREGGLELLTLHGAWGRERKVCRREITEGRQSVASIRGVSSHQENPFMALLDPDATEDTGRVYGFNFVYSGNFLAQVEKNQFGHVRAVMGIHPYHFSWKLLPGEIFTAPEVVMVYSPHGVGGMTRSFHDLYRSHLIRGRYRDRKRPILINNWEATYFDFNTEKLWSIAEEAASLGIEMLVMDDGWFGCRNDDNTSLGDWFANEEKLPGGLKRLADGVRERGLAFGIWVEPEMVNPDSELFREHPDWILQYRDREVSRSRNQYVLDIGRKEVRDEIYRRIYDVVKEADVDYVKWDMNRSLTNVASHVAGCDEQGMVYHQYVLGVYEMQNRLVTDFPNLLLENCSSGGGRFDPGMLYYSPQIWCSDDTDAIERLEIQRGTAMVYPLSAMGAHVSDCPNHATHRTTPFDTRGQVALCGTFGYELDVTKLVPEEKEKIKEQVAMYHRYNDLIRAGDYYRIASLPDTGSYDCYMVVSKDGAEALVSFVRVVNRINRWSERIHLKGLEGGASYRLSDREGTFTGSMLMNIGIEIQGAEKDFEGKLIAVSRCE